MLIFWPSRKRVTLFLISLFLISLMMNLLTDRFLLATLVAVALLVAIAAVAARRQALRRSDALVAALAASVRGRVACAQGPAAGGFLATLQPAPEPFVDFRCEYRSAATPNPLDWLGGRSARLRLLGVVDQRPAAELIWQRGRVAAQALGGHSGSRSRTTLWELRRLDIVDAEFLVRGADTGAVERVFLDLQARFGTHLLPGGGPRGRACLPGGGAADGRLPSRGCAGARGDGPRLGAGGAAYV